MTDADATGVDGLEGDPRGDEGADGTSDGISDAGAESDEASDGESGRRFADFFAWRGRGFMVVSGRANVDKKNNER